MTVTPVSNIPVSIDYTGRDYYSLRDSLISRIQSRIPEWTASDPADFGVALVEAFAYLGDLISYYIDRTANETFLETAVQRQSILNIAQTYGYIPAGYRQAAVNVTFNNTSDADITIPAGTVLTGDVAIGDVVETIYFTTDADALVSAAVDNTPGETTVGAFEGRSVNLIAENVNTYGELIGTSDGSPDQVFELSQTPVVDGTIEIYIQDGDIYSKWTQVQHLIDYGTADLVYTTFLDENGVVSINFGDGVSGVIPTNYSEVRAKYTVGGGSIGNVSTNTINTINYISGLSESQLTAIQGSVSVTNLSIGFGGSDPESNDQIRVAAPAALRSGNRAVTLTDFSDISLSVSGVGKANATASVWTSVTVYIAPSRIASDADPAPGLDTLGATTPEFTRIQKNVISALSTKTLIGTTVTVQPPTYVDVIINLQYVKLSQYTTAEVETNIKTALFAGFGYVGVKFQDTIYPQDIEYVLQQASGVKTVKVLALHEQGGSGLTTLVGGPGEIYRFTETNLSLSPA
jgi:Baseplate J-like protein